MWRTTDGVLHTVALPDPARAFTGPGLAAALAVLDALDEEQRDTALDQLEDDAVEAWEAVDGPVDPSAEQPFHAAAVPAGTFDALPTDPAQLLAAVAALDPRWQLDVALALQDVVKGVDGGLVGLPGQVGAVGHGVAHGPTPDEC